MTLDDVLFTVTALSLRLAPAAATLPVFGGPRASPTVRSAIVLVLAVAAWPSDPVVAPADAVGGAAVLATQLFLGLCVAGAILVVFEVPRMLGGLADVALGRGSFGAADPFGAAGGPLGTLHALAFLAVYVAAGGHLVLIAAIARGVRVFPLDATLTLDRIAALVDLVLAASDVALTTAVALALPALAVAWLVDMTLGWLARTLPSLPALFLSMPLRMALGTVVVSATLAGVAAWTVAELDRAAAAASAVGP